MPANDADLLRRWADGDADAGNELFDRHFMALHRFFRNKVGEAADDLVQITFLACVEGHAGFQHNASFRTWLLAIARRKLYDRYRDARRDAQRFEPESVSIQALGATPSAAVAKKAEHQLLLLALRNIPLASQIAVELYYFEGMRGPAIAEVLGVPEGTVRGRLRRGLEALRREIERLGRTPALIESTLGDLEGWAEALRDRLGK